MWHMTYVADDLNGTLPLLPMTYVACYMVGWPDGLMD